MLLINNNPATMEAMSEAERTALMGDVDQLIAELTASGELVGGEALADGSHTRTVRVRDGVPTVTDGPFLEAKEYLAGYLIIEAESVDRAVEIAARWPDARYGAMEVRPIMDSVGLEM
ncbi:YciI family protein [Longispora fulva]|nr:YciI family protein [Longispora fulva]